MKSTPMACRIWASTKWPMRALAITGIVYIYQNRIDAIGDKAASGRGVVEACSQAIAEIALAVREIANQLNGTNIFVTSDHWFLYQRQPLAPHTTVRPPSGDVVDSG